MMNNTYRNPKIWSLLTKFIEILQDRSLDPLTYNEIKLVKELKTNIAKISFLPKVSSKAENEWRRYSNRVIYLIKNKDPREFLRWNVIRSTMNVTNSFFIIKEYIHLRRDRKWKKVWKKVIKEDKAGHPIPFFLYPCSSGNLIHHAYILSKFDEKIKENIADIDFIFEFGGGYGGLCRLIHKLGFKGKYIIFDFPVFSVLQTFFLNMVGIPAYFSNKAIKHKMVGVDCISDINELKKNIYNFSSKPLSKSLFIATWSLSESPIKIRKKFLELLPLFNLYLIAYQDRFGEVNNKKFFDNWKKEKDIIFYDWKIKHLPGHNFLIGKR